MSSRSPSRPSGDVNVDVDVDERSMGRLRSLRTQIRSRRHLSGPTDASMPTPSPHSVRSRHLLPGPTAASMPTASTPVDPTAASISTTATPVDLFQFSTGGPSYATVVRFGLRTVPKPQPQQESGSESDLELDSPPRLTALEDEDDKLDIPTSPGGSSEDEMDRCGSTPPPSIDIGPAVLPTFGSDTEEWHFSDDQEDLYFKSLVDNFVSAVGDVYKSMLPEDTICKEADNQLQSNRYAMSALKHYNNSEDNKVKYELIDAITSGGMIDMNGGYGHVNFTAKANQENSKEELFFAELRFHHNTYIATCVLSLEGEKSVGGLCGSKYDNHKNGFFIDAKHCYACGRGLKHPKNGALYEAGHVADSDYYHG
ncbi:uncharacterized protein LOC8057532 [Sorghum bicolor]|nr:uncharacterized protein LOC8057532 [Sorghum bicolor]|eukprot:XP_002451500.1 uncharacterized protein LOC8057532 [Sorghum bicolor]